jgi:hypothetical protein
MSGAGGKILQVTGRFRVCGLLSKWRCHKVSFSSCQWSNLWKRESSVHEDSSLHQFLHRAEDAPVRGNLFSD